MDYNQIYFSLKQITIYEHKLKNNYIWEYKVYEYSYDFRNKSTSQITADGWSIVQWWCLFNSYWVRNNSSDWMLRLINKVVWLQTKMTSCKKLIIEFTRYTTWEAAFAWAILNETPENNFTGIYQDNRLWDIRFRAGWSNLISLSTTISWTVKFRWEYDLVNKSAEFSWNWANARTATLTDEAINNIRSASNAVYVYFRWNPSTSNLWGFSDINITIEY